MAAGAINMTHDDASRDAQTPFSEPRQPTEAAGQNPRIRKDLWDKLSAVSTFLSGVLIAAIGLLFTYLHNESEGQRNTSLKISESHIAETRAFEKFIPYLNSAKEADINIGLIGLEALNKELGG